MTLIYLDNAMLKRVLLILLSVFILEIDAQENIKEIDQYEISIIPAGPEPKIINFFFIMSFINMNYNWILKLHIR